ncbi:serine/threonine-protein kinase [Streptomyces sp. MST-110588]|uniref:serine/threonine-protein kinase n=1 Tax=Streptomyces sp. MST-110588 TaxID=2833628 RepID=UPI001F5C30A3|nr:serine/threonine-protein kinase [Streptomyces sp. MST-110588]UNO41746.1 serine/threonine protein kinase [Streptomyces sp. MST-110588]
MARKIGSRYTAHQILGRGSAGTVWLGDGPEGAVAIKLLREDLASDQELVGRFVQERAALLGLDHPRVVGVRDLVVDGNDLALVMDLVRGTDLRTRLERERRLAPEAAVAITADVADGLAAAHAAGIVHRDVKPENILLDMQGPLGPAGAHPALLTDFGIARLVDSPRRTLPQPPAGGSSAPLRSTKVIGTPDYLAPEIIEGLPPRASVDVYALATVLYELLAGFTPFGGGHPGAVLRRHVTETVAPLPGIPDELWQLLLQCLAKAPASRLRAPELAARLREMLPGLAGLPPLDIDEPGSEDPDGPEGAAGPAGPGARAEAGVRTRAASGPYEDARRAAPSPGEGRPRGAVPLVHGAVPDSNRDTHTSMRVPGPEELAGGAHGTARAPRAAGERRAGSARHRSSPEAVRRRRIKIGVAATALLAAVGVGGWLATSQDDGGSGKPAGTQHSKPARSGPAHSEPRVP